MKIHEFFSIISILERLYMSIKTGVMYEVGMHHEYSFYGRIDVYIVIFTEINL